jgi:hypothetical protein
VKVVHAPQELPEAEEGYSGSIIVPNSIFLAGPTPRDSGVKSWRPEALAILKEWGFTGYAFVPETEDWGWCGNYNRQVEWEWDALGRASRVLFWVPRDLETMPAFTTNVEFGMMAMYNHERMILGFPEGAPKNRYLASIANNYERFAKAFNLPPMNDNIPVVHTLREAVLYGVDYE